MSTLHEAFICVLIYFADINNKKGKKKREAAQEPKDRSIFHLEAGVKSDRGGEKMDPETGLAEMKTVQKKQQILEKLSDTLLLVLTKIKRVVIHFTCVLWLLHT